jgi:hypothetical protein
VSLSTWDDLNRTFNNPDGLGGIFELWQSGASPKKFILKVRAYHLDGPNYNIRGSRVLFSDKAAFVAKLSSLNSGAANFAIDKIVPYMDPADPDWTFNDYSLIADWSDVQQNTNIHGALSGDAIEWSVVYKTATGVPNWGSGKTLGVQIFITAR